MCTRWEDWWKGFFVDKVGNDQFVSTEVAEAIAENLCNSPTGEILIVDRDYVCGAVGWGFATYGWPGQIVRALGYAVQAGVAGQTDYFHPQCSGLQNRVVM